MGQIFTDISFITIMFYLNNFYICFPHSLFVCLFQSFNQGSQLIINFRILNHIGAKEWLTKKKQHEIRKAFNLYRWPTHCRLLGRQMWEGKKNNSYQRNLPACPTVILKLLVEHSGTCVETGSNLFSDMILWHKSVSRCYNWSFLTVLSS